MVLLAAHTRIPFPKVLPVPYHMKANPIPAQHLTQPGKGGDCLLFESWLRPTLPVTEKLKLISQGLSNCLLCQCPPGNPEQELVWYQVGGARCREHTQQMKLCRKVEEAVVWANREEHRQGGGTWGPWSGRTGTGCPISLVLEILGKSRD